MNYTDKADKIALRLGLIALAALALAAITAEVVKFAAYWQVAFG
jgi:hypothetical protein